MRRPSRDDRGQVVILYGGLVGLLLFAAFAFFAVAQAGDVRNRGQSAADAAALAAAQDDREQLYDGFLDALEDKDALQDWLDGLGDITGDGCAEADRFAGRNDADVLSCEQVARNGDDGYTVRIRTRFDTGKTFVPGTGGKKAEASATAVIKPLCEIDEDADEIEIGCAEEDFTLDPDADDVEVEPSDLFSVVLVD
ncbi:MULTISPECIES: pilus assembly protein TadG-related protein [unclassified Streptomyces]|uniref:pilus assembly protein TadG-related protein n=1 Tax=unclassified Streptomyces TaxID=2593676 RepID=UPI0022772E00|nr:MULTISPECIES: pilus assembly protein TadG-related protein [unclassified Streptomyces]